MCLRSRESISLSAGAPRHVVNGSALSTHVWLAAWLPHLRTEYVLQLLKKLGMTLAKPQMPKQERLDEYRRAFCSTLRIAALHSFEDDVSDMEDSYNTASLGYISFHDH
jgi:hypothetical protein